VPALGMGISWFGWSLGLWGYCLIRGYNVKFTDLINPLHAYSGGWPPPLIDDPTVLLPQGASADTLPKLPADPFGTPPPTGKQIAGTFPKVKPGQ
jgi:hypothetical protein